MCACVCDLGWQLWVCPVRQRRSLQLLLPPLHNLPACLPTPPPSPPLPSRPPRPRSARVTWEGKAGGGAMEKRSGRESNRICLLFCVVAHAICLRVHFLCFRFFLSLSLPPLSLSRSLFLHTIRIKSWSKKRVNPTCPSASRPPPPPPPTPALSLSLSPSRRFLTPLFRGQLHNSADFTAAFFGCCFFFQL